VPISLNRPIVTACHRREFHRFPFPISLLVPPYSPRRTEIYPQLLSTVVFFLPNSFFCCKVVPFYLFVWSSHLHLRAGKHPQFSILLAPKVYIGNSTKFPCPPLFFSPLPRCPCASLPLFFSTLFLPFFSSNTLLLEGIDQTDHSRSFATRLISFSHPSHCFSMLATLGPFFSFFPFPFQADMRCSNPNSFEAPFSVSPPLQ